MTNAQIEAALKAYERPAFRLGWDVGPDEYRNYLRELLQCRKALAGVMPYVDHEGGEGYAEFQMRLRAAREALAEGCAE